MAGVVTFYFDRYMYWNYVIPENLTDLEQEISDLKTQNRKDRMKDWNMRQNINLLYLEHLDREATDKEVSHWIWNGLELEEIESAIKNSDEYSNILYQSKKGSGGMTQEEKVVSSNILEELERDTGINFSETKNDYFRWMYYENEKYKSINIEGLMFEAVVDLGPRSLDDGIWDSDNKIKSFFVKNGFRLSGENVGMGTFVGSEGWIKNDVICRVSSQHIRESNLNNIFSEVHHQVYCSVLK